MLGIHRAHWSMVLYAAAAFWCAGAHAQTRIHFDLPAQPLARTLEAIGAATHVDIGFSSSRVAGFTAPALKADLTVDDALLHVLSGTGLRPQRLNDHTVVITSAESSTSILPGSAPLPRKATPAGQPADASGAVNGINSPSPLRLAQTDATLPDNGLSPKSEDNGSPADQLQEVTVTGSHIRGEVPIGSQLQIYSREDLDQSGAATLDEFARVMPQNFSNTDGISNFSSNGNYAAFSATGSNISNGAAFNIHGLGPSATLTLINGHRIAPTGSDGSLTDISQIPLSAVDHIEVLSDGASAIYGTDAVAGVVNIITKKDFDGAETGLRYGGATEGGAREVTASQLWGRSWSGGNALLTYEYDDQGGLDASQRSYIP
ncbi:MAG TPA: TonB-dependent receptor, partial [Steroidobacteraceae bacterium]